MNKNILIEISKLFKRTRKIMDELKGISITTAEELLDEDFHSDSSSDNN